jgi:uncharacterized protein YcbK (DUF882 family)
MEDISRRGFLENMLKAAIGTAIVTTPEICQARTSGQVVVPYLGKINLTDKVLSNGHFNWNDVTKYGTRIPQNLEVVKNILRSASAMEDIRKYFGNLPISVNSWYRTPEVNKAVGGKPQSQHLYGNAVDFNVQGISPYEVYAKLDKSWGNKGGLGKYHAFTHADIRGSYARWVGS